MPRFYFDIYDGNQATIDDTGLELPNLDAARDQAALTLPGIAKDVMPETDRRDFVVVIRDAAKQPVLQAKFSFSVEPLK